MRAWLACVVSLLLAGCVEFAPDPTATGTNKPSTQTATDTQDADVRLVASIAHDQETHAIAAAATNHGSRTYLVRGLCETPWSDDVRNARSEPVETTGPRYQCQGFSWEEFGPGDQRSRTFSWNETVWNSETERLEHAPPGNYTWQVTFRFYADEDDDGDVVSAAFSVRVG